MVQDIVGHIQCRRVGVGRLDEWMELETLCFESDRASRRNMRRLFSSSSAACCGAFIGDGLVGTLVMLFRSNSTVGRIYSLAVHPEFRGQGIARKLLEQAEAEARQRGCRCLSLEVRVDNAGAQQLYASSGFIASGRRPDYYEDGAAAVVLRKELV